MKRDALAVFLFETDSLEFAICNSISILGVFINEGE